LKTKEKLDFEVCGWDKFPIDHEIIERNGIYEYYCPTQDYGVRGHYYSPIFDYLDIKVVKTDFTEETNSFVAGLTFELIMINSYLDLDSYE